MRRTLLRGVVSALVAASLAITAAQQLASDGPWWLELSRYLPFPLMLAPAVLALLLSLWLGRRWLVISATAVLLFATVAMGFVWNAQEQAPADLRIVTYNTKAAQLLERTGDIAPIEREIVGHRPDIVVMQDANGIRHWRGYDPNGPLFGSRTSSPSANTPSPAAGRCATAPWSRSPRVPSRCRMRVAASTRTAPPSRWSRSTSSRRAWA